MTKQQHVNVGNFNIANNLPLTVIAGPCAMESPSMAIDTAGALTEICAELGVNYIFKNSFDKANRLSLESKRGVGLEAALPVFAKIKQQFGCPIITDFHSPEQCQAVKDYVDVLQIPAFLCRQTDLLVAAANTGLVVNIKKGQFVAPENMQSIARKVTASGNNKVVLTERGTCFGYNNLISDMRALPIMSSSGMPVVYDVSHSVQYPGGQGGSSGGDRRFIPHLARAAVAVGVAGIFIETHPKPAEAISDKATQWPLAEFKDLLSSLIDIDQIVKANSYQLDLADA
ncbi:MAG: 3-deoxy-8-phosphooctulonate synthase [Pseudomonadota bacterium]